MTDLAQLQRIILAIEPHLAFSRQCPCGQWCDTGPGEKRIRHNHAEHIADAVMAAL